MIFGLSSFLSSDLYIEEKEELSQASDEGRCDELKNRLRALLDRYDGSTKEPDVIETIESLSALSPFQDHSAEWLNLFIGEFLTQTSPNFAGRLPPSHEGDRRVQYTLGRLSFNTFHPNDLVCTLHGVRNVVEPQQDGTFSYHLICDITIHLSGGDVEAEIANESFCCRDDNSNRVHVFFTGSNLYPARSVMDNEGKFSLWTNTFDEATLETAAAERTYFGWIIDKVLKRMLGMDVRFEKPYSFRMEFKKALKGHIDVLYLDEEMRITKGNRGTIVVVERL